MPAFTSEQLAVSALRALSIDAVEAAGSGHPGLPMGAAPMAYALWAHHLTHNPKNPEWFNRDRFVLSAGHGSALLYSLLHMAGFHVTKDDLREFRKLGSRTPGHPERGHTPGVETTTGPLGQGLANAVGMAMAERFLAATFNRNGFPVVDHRTFALVGDGDLMEGISNEAASLAGHLRLGKLVVLYDSNQICLDGPISNTFTEDVQARFTALGWRTLRVADGNDVGAIRRALEDACRRQDRPTLIEVRTIIGFGSPARQGTAEAHGKPLGPEQARLAKLSYGWPETPPFHVPPLAYDAFAPAATRGAQAEAKWHEIVSQYRRAHPELGQAFMRAQAGDPPTHLEQALPKYADGAALATREASGAALNAIAEQWPTFIGGSADLSSSNNTTITSSRIFSEADPAGRNIWFGVREHAMGGALNGLALHGGVRAYGGTFLAFSDYMRPAIRLAALMGLPVTYVFTHDSIALGEDGPTHQPVEQLPSLRLIPNLLVLRPADARETAAAWQIAATERKRPCALILSRQKLPVLPGTAVTAGEGVGRGGYVVSAEQNQPLVLILIASGSEVSLACAAQKQLEHDGIGTRVVSMPCTRLFDEQSQAYRDEVLPPAVVARLGIELSEATALTRYTGFTGATMGMTTFGASGKEADLLAYFHFTVADVVRHARDLLAR